MFKTMPRCLAFPAISALFCNQQVRVLPAKTIGPVTDIKVEVIQITMKFLFFGVWLGMINNTNDNKKMFAKKILLAVIAITWRQIGICGVTCCLNNATPCPSWALCPSGSNPSTWPGKSCNLAQQLVINLRSKIFTGAESWRDAWCSKPDKSSRKNSWSNDRVPCPFQTWAS